LAFPPLQSSKSEKIHSQKQLRSQSGPSLQVSSVPIPNLFAQQILGSLKEKLIYYKSISYSVRQELKPLLLLVERTESFAMTTYFLIWFTASADRYRKNHKPVHSAFLKFHINIYWELEMDTGWLLHLNILPKLDLPLYFAAHIFQSHKRNARQVVTQTRSEGQFVSEMSISSFQTNSSFWTFCMTIYFCCERLEEGHYICLEYG